jgi:hypothetical protein
MPCYSRKNTVVLSRTGDDVKIERESVLFIGTRFSNLYTALDTPSMYDGVMV